MQPHHGQGFGLVFRSQLLEEEHTRVVDEDIDLEAFSLAKSIQFISGGFDGQILIMCRHLNVTPLLQRLGSLLQFFPLVTD